MVEPYWQDDSVVLYHGDSEELLAEARRDFEAERTELTMARMSASVKLARLAALCREKPDRVCAEDVLRIIGDEEGTGHA